MKWFLLVLNLSLFPAIAREKPNIIVFLVDDLGARDLSCYGSSFYETPHIDRLAAEGTRFISAYSASSVCSPSRAALLTGLHPSRIGITDWIPGAGDQGKKLKTPTDLHALPLEHMTIGEAFRDQGYASFYAGKWHLGGEGFTPVEQGFQTYFNPHRNPDKGQPPRKKTTGVSGRTHLTREITEAANDFLMANKDRPQFLYLSYFDVHTPVIAEEEFLPYYRRKAASLPPGPEPDREGSAGEAQTRRRQGSPQYASMVHTIDWSVGQVLAKLRTLGLENDTIIVFTSDNGGLSTARFPCPTSNHPLRAGKGWLYEGGIRVPLIIRIPGKEAGIDQTVTSQTDLFPTLLALAGLPAPSVAFDGIDLFSNSPALSDRTLLWHFPHYHGSAWTPGSALRKGPWKLIHFYETNRFELYNLDKDPGETKELSIVKTREMERLLPALKTALQETGSQLPLIRQD